jgi:hypothetical protein
MNSCTQPLPQSKAQTGMCIVFEPCTAGELLKWKVIVVFPFTNTNELAGVPFTVKSLASTVPGSAAPLRLTVKSVGAVPTTMLPQRELVTEQPVGVAVGVGVGVGEGVGPDCAQYFAPVLKTLTLLYPAQTIISPPVQTAVCQKRAAGTPLVLVAVQLSVPGLYLPPVFNELAF